MDILGILFWAFMIWTAWSLLKRAQQRSELEDHVLQEVDRRIRVVKLEQVPDHKTILAFDQENHDFLGQGADESEVKKCIMERFPEKIFLLDGTPFTALKNDIIAKI
jgi:hypothetical protein